MPARIDHADGNLDEAQARLEESVHTSDANAPGVGGIWLGWLLTDRGDIERAAPVVEVSQHDRTVTIHHFGLAHRALLAAYTAGLNGRIAEALSWLQDVESEVDRRHLCHFVGRSHNYRAWLLRNILATSEADDLNVTAAGIAAERGLREPQAHAALELADGRMRRGDLAAAASFLAQADQLSETKYAFVWHARLRYALLSARLAMADGQWDESDHLATDVVQRAQQLGMVRYVSLARLISAEARAKGGRPVDPETVAGVVEHLDRVAGPEAWWITAEVAAACGVDAWWPAAEQRVARLASGAGEYKEQFVRQAGTMLDKIRTSRRSG